VTKYLTDERFIVHSNTKEAQDNYRANYDRIFGEPEEQRVGYIAGFVMDPAAEEPVVCHAQMHHDNTGMMCRNAGKAVPLSALEHDACYTCNKLHELITRSE
jgi:hypothetical protein